MPVPFVALRPASPVVASAGWALEGLQAESLRDESGRPVERSERFEAIYRAGTRLLQLVARSEAPCAIELHLASRPSLDPAVAARVRIGIRLHLAADKHEEALEGCLAHAILLGPLLNHLWEGATFRPVAGEEEPQWFAPFAPRSCLRVERRRERIWLAHPFESRPKGPLGFTAPAGGRPATEEETLTVEHCFPWVPSWDDWGLLLETLLTYPAPQWLVVRMANRAPVEEALGRCEAALEACERFLAGGAGLTLAAQTQLVRDAHLDRARRLRESALRGAVLLCSPGPSDPGLADLVGQSISGDLSRGTVSNPYQGGFRVAPASPRAALEPFAHFEVEPFTAAEAACAFRLPLIFSSRDRGLPIRRNRVLPAQLPAGASAEGERTRLGVNRWQDAERAIEVSVAHRLKHTFLIGMTGTGKSTAMLSMLLQDLEQGRGVCLIDPHGELADDLLARLPGRTRQDLIVIDLADRERPVPLNLLAWRTLVERDVIIDELLASLLRIYRDPQMFGPIFEANFRAMLKLLMGDRPDDDPFTLVEFPHLYLSEDFRQRLLERTREQEVKDFVEELERVRGENSMANLAPYITNKFARFLQDPQMRRIVGHGAMALDFSEILETGKVLVVKLARGQFGASVADLLASHLVARMRLAAMARMALPRERRTPYFLYVDEFGSIARDENFSRLLSEARKCGLGLVLSTQFAAQLRDPDSRHDNLAAVLGNAGTVICFRVGVEDARLLEPVFAPAVSALDLAECPNFEGYMRLHMDAGAVRPFSFRTLLPPGQPDCERARKWVAASRRRWGVPAAECDRRIAARRPR